MNNPTINNFPDVSTKFNMKLVKDIQIIQKYYLNLRYSKINEQISAALYKINTLTTFVTETNDAQVEIMVGTLVLDLESHLIVFKVAICMHKLKY